MIECYEFQDSQRWSLKCWQVGIDDWFPLHKQSISQQISTRFLPWTVKEMYTEFLSHWLFIFQYTSIIYTRKYNIRDCIQHLWKQSHSSNLKGKNYVGDGGLFLCWFWLLSHQVRRRPCGKSAYPVWRVKINWTWTQTGMETASLHGPFPLHANNYNYPGKFMVRCNHFQKDTWWKTPQVCVMWGCKSSSWSERGLCLRRACFGLCLQWQHYRVPLLSPAQQLSSHKESSIQAGMPWVRMCDPVASPQQTQTTHSCLRASWRVRKSTPKVGSDIGHNWNPCWIQCNG